MRSILTFAQGLALALAMGLFLLVAPPLAAQEAPRAPVVVELYTSQGCSSCPPADALLGQLAQRDDVLALALHVDYWDYIGWKDRFAKPAYTARQKRYARTAGRRSVYTPQMIINGQDHVVGTYPMNVTDLIRMHKARVPVARVTARRVGNQLVIELDTSRPVDKAVVQLIRYSPREAVAITRGENAGRNVVYHNIVRDWRVVGKWDGRGAHRMQMPAPETDNAAVIVQAEGGYGAILAAARLR